ncbi:aldose 1-epimerase family protein [Pacificibacter marinus]|uniref:Aldose 1-epimerase n=1 Tax=Pacificibacter marinus TaxID=658057 RepID=A0A1Y5SXT6_9RHOB|nr:aldose 1-epimerase family protein [Pacificibacter marinus]SEL06166.1 Galactose mutarotase [Pacificibacter marinus]SLN51089.1 Aldose 1-epimerase [Pacificibacter marinus]
MSPDLTRIESSHLSLTVSALGAEMQSLCDHDGDEWLWQGDPDVWAGRAPVLFPIVGRAPDDCIAIGDHTAQMQQHGFARRSRFHLEQSSASMCRYVLTATQDTRALYPFDFSLSLTYSLDGPKLTVTAEVKNCSTDDMPFGFGFHPAFSWPLPGGEGRMHSVTLANGAEPLMARLETGLLTEKRHPSPFVNGMLSLEGGLFNEDAMIFPQGAGTALSYGMVDGPCLKFHFENLPNLALWSKPKAPFICVEPWHGMAAKIGTDRQISKRPFSMILKPTEASLFSYSVCVATG